MFPSLLRAYRYTEHRHTTQGEERRMLYADRDYWKAHLYSRTKKDLGRAYGSGGRDDQAKEEHSGAPERFGASSAPGDVSAVRPGRLRRAP